MKNIFIKFLSIIIASILLVTFASCKETDKPESSLKPVIKGEYLIKNGVTQFKIVIPKDADSNETLAGNELKNCFKEATSVETLIISDENLNYTEQSYYLSVGDTTLSQQAKISIDYNQLGSQGFVVKTLGHSIFMVGAETLGTLYSVYEFLYQAFEFEVFSADECYIKPTIELGLLDLDIKDKPDIEYRLNGYGYFSQSTAARLNATRLRINDNPIIGVGNGYIYTTHNTTKYFTKEQLDANSEFMGNDGNQLCYTARGNSEKLALMQSIVLDVMKDAIINNPTKTAIAFMQEDFNTWCSCDECKKVIEKHNGFHTSTQIIFVNAVAKELKVWLKENYPDRRVQIVFFAYHKTTNAPVKYNESAKQYEAISEDIILEDNVGVYYAPITADYYYSFTDSKNAPYAEILKGWSSISKNVYMWVYSTDFREYLMFFDTFNSMPENYKFMKQNNAKMVFENTQYNNTNSTSFHVLKGYLNAKLGWDSAANYNELIDKFFLRYFQEAEKPMRELFDQNRLWTAKLIENNDLTGDVYEDLCKTDYYSYSVLLQWEGLINKAYEAIKPIKETDQKRYEKLYNRINLESIYIRYAQIQLYGGRYDSSVLEKLKQNFKKDAMDLNISNVAEGAKMLQLYTNWGV